VISKANLNKVGSVMDGSQVREKLLTERSGGVI